MRRLVIFIAIGVVIGLALALLVGWVIAPVQITQGGMGDLARNYKSELTLMVASAYHVDCDLNEAFNRLKPLGESNIPVYIRQFTESYLSSSGTGKEADARNLIALSRDMGYYTAPMQTLVPNKTVCIPQQPGS